MGRLFKLTDTEQLLLGLVTTVTLLCCLFTAHNIRLMWGFRDHYWLRPRWTNVQIVLVGAWAMVYLLSRPLWTWEAFVRRGEDLQDLTPNERFLHSFTEVISAMALTGMSIGFCIRVWYQYYTAMVAVQIGVAEWRGMIDESLVKDKMGWFLRNQRTWGNRKFLDKLGAAVFATVTAIAILFEGVLTLGDFSYLLLITGSSLLIISFFAWKYPSFKDGIYLRREKKNILWILGPGLCGWVSSGFISRVMGWDWEKNPSAMAHIECFRTIWTCMVMVGCYYAVSQLVMLAFERPSMTMFSSHFCSPLPCASDLSKWNLPLSFKMNRPGGTSLLQMKRVGSMSMASSSGSPRDGSKSGSGATGNAALLKDTMEDNMKFRAFMAHLFREYSQENALCMIECLKYKQRMIYLLKKQEKGGSPSPPSTRGLVPNSSHSSGSNAGSSGVSEMNSETKQESVKKYETEIASIKQDQMSDDDDNDNEEEEERPAPVKRAVTMADLVNNSSPRSQSRFTFGQENANGMSETSVRDETETISSAIPTASALRSMLSKSESDFFGRNKRGKTSGYIESIKFCSDIRESKSTLVSQMKNLEDAQSVANLLCQRYIREDAPYCVNLSFRQRFQLLEKVESSVDIESSTLESTVFDGVIIACTHLLKESMSRMNENYHI